MEELAQIIKNEITKEIIRLEEQKEKTLNNQEQQILSAQINGLVTAGQIAQYIILNYNK